MQRRAFEQYAYSVSQFALAGLGFYSGVRHSSWVDGVFGVVMLLIGCRVKDFSSEGRWWAALACYGVLGALAAAAAGERAGGARFTIVVMAGCLLAVAGLLVLGRLRRVWAFARRE